jgi:hypothetical protein
MFTSPLQHYPLSSIWRQCCSWGRKHNQVVLFFLFPFTLLCFPSSVFDLVYTPHPSNTPLFLVLFPHVCISVHTHTQQTPPHFPILIPCLLWCTHYTHQINFCSLSTYMFVLMYTLNTQSISFPPLYHFLWIVDTQEWDAAKTSCFGALCVCLVHTHTTLHCLYSHTYTNTTNYINYTIIYSIHNGNGGDPLRKPKERGGNGKCILHICLSLYFLYTIIYTVLCHCIILHVHPTYTMTIYYNYINVHHTIPYHSVIHTINNTTFVSTFYVSHHTMCCSHTVNAIHCEHHIVLCCVYCHIESIYSLTLCHFIHVLSTYCEHHVVLCHNCSPESLYSMTHTTPHDGLFTPPYIVNTTLFHTMLIIRPFTM